jgi:phenylacetate-CoA ligase
MHINEAFFLVEIEDIETEEPITEPGRRGKLIITALDRIAQPCVRFDAKDVIAWSSATCACGRTYRLLEGGVVGRTDDITKVKGVLLAPSAIEAVVRSIAGLGNEYEVVVDKLGEADRITLKVEIMPDAQSRVSDVRHALIDQLRFKTNLAYHLKFYDYGRLPRYEVKAKRFKDMRNT